MNRIAAATLFVTTLVTALASVSARAQQPGPNAAADSATVARLAWQRASTAMQSGDLTAARREVEHAATAWPTQEAYAWGRVILAARAADTAALISGLNAYADLGIGRDLRAEPSIAPFVSMQSFAQLLARHAAHRTDLRRGTVRATLPDSTFWPEGVDYDPRTQRYYVASVRHGTIAEVRSDGTTRELLARRSANIGAMLAVRVDTARGVLWATTSGIPQMQGYSPRESTIAALLRIRISDGYVERRWDLAPSPHGHTLGDVALDARGNVYVSDSNDPVLYMLPLRGDSLVPLRHPLFRSLQGIAPTPDARTVYVADYSHGILRVDVVSHTVTRVADAPRSISLGCDGIAWYRGSIIAVQNGVDPARVMRFTLSVDGTRFTEATVLDRDLRADEPTIGTIVGDDFVYVANSQWNKHDDAGTRAPRAILTRPILLAVPLRP